MKSFIKISLIPALFQIGYAKQAQTNSTAPIKGSYIVTLKSSTNDKEFDEHLDKVRNQIGKDQHSSGKNEINYVYRDLLKGYSAEFTNDVLAEVKAMPEVNAIEKDQVVKVSSVQEKSSWGLARLSSDDRLSRNFKYWSYTHDPDAGEGVDVYVIDSGIQIDHPNFEGRAKWGKNFVNDIDTDENGHGTHVAGIIGSKTYGVAKKSTLFAVKVLNPESNDKVSRIIAGVSWAIQNRRKGQGCVINISMGDLQSNTMNDAMAAAVGLGCVVVAAAGNDNEDACNISPASEPKVITVGASSIHDTRASFSNWGKCLDVFAPGEYIFSTTKQGGARHEFGTSMAAAHVSGLAANVMSKTKNYNSSYVKNYIIEHSKSGVLKNVGEGSPNLLVSNIGLV
ncbi:hypothetical protein DSO57_1010924 [Entomophthora muscae]|uniref:Uncharacterized protein n=1 Tax=Entomophthora muscae TaxID=34485 RepID=A0ACC2SV86_9FUNG|nr:hypothetical protein DSO57_1010924 [Entomophthora muscae]